MRAPETAAWYTWPKGEVALLMPNDGDEGAALAPEGAGGLVLLTAADLIGDDVFIRYRVNGDGLIRLDGRPTGYTLADLRPAATIIGRA